MDSWFGLFVFLFFWFSVLHFCRPVLLVMVLFIHIIWVALLFSLYWYVLKFTSSSYLLCLLSMSTSSLCDSVTDLRKFV